MISSYGELYSRLRVVRQIREDRSEKEDCLVCGPWLQSRGSELMLACP